MGLLRSILLAEDNARDTELTLSALEEYHLANRVIVARDGVEALDYLYRRGAFADRDERDPVVVFLDLKMPRVNGLEVLKTIKADENLKSIPVVIVTSSREEADLVRSYKLGANAFVVKPVDFDAFAQAIMEVGIFWAVLNEPPPENTFQQAIY